MDLACDMCSYLVVLLKKKHVHKLKKFCPDIEDVLHYALNAFCKSFHFPNVTLMPDIGEEGRSSYVVKVCCDQLLVEEFCCRLQKFLNEALFEYLCQCSVPERCLRYLKVVVM